MATKSFDEKVIVRDQKIVSKMKSNLESDDFAVKDHKRNTSCTAQSTIDNSKKWVL